MRIFKYALKNVARNSFLSFSTVLVLSLMTFFIYVLFFVEYVASAIIGNISDRLSLSLNLRSGYSDTSSEIVELTNGLRAVDPSVEVRYVSNVEAFEILKKRDPELARVIESDKDNPLPSSVSVKNVPIAKYAELDAIVSKHRDAVQYDAGTGKKTIVDYRAQYEKIKGLTDVLISIRYGTIAVVGLFLFAVAAIVYNAIGNSVFYYREEIRIIGLVGGGARFVYGPFAIQGLVYALVAAVISLAGFSFVIRSVNFSLLADFPIFVDKFFVERSEAFLSVVAALAFVALVSGFLSSFRFARRAA
ncbi:MAG: cell division transport system permease protein [Patescibacteria group bacterium]|nr:cell division transport system permease protein [Patescibacteria group bacterium]